MMNIKFMTATFIIRVQDMFFNYKCRIFKVKYMFVYELKYLQIV